MEKPLHERLREHTDDDLHFVCDGSMLVSISRKGAQRIADEIERDYVTKEQHEAEITRISDVHENVAHHVIEAWSYLHGMPMRKNETITEWLDRWTVMRPRFEDGEPVPGNHEDDRVSYYYVYDDGSWVLRPVGEDGSDLEEINGHADEHVKLAVHKVYDADGAEIKVGDTVWFANSGTERTVKSLRQHDDGGYEIEFTNGLYCTSPYQLTHERPVFDAEGVRIRKGDTVWTKAGIKREVAKVGTEPCEGMEEWDGSPWVMFTNGSWMHAKDLTHREPDSFEKLRYDILREDRTRGMSCVHVWADRITALMERGA